MNLPAIEDATSREDWRAALSSTLAWWQSTRAPELADLVDVLGARLAAPLPSPAPAPVFNEVWLLAVATDPVGNLGPALATITRALPLGTITWRREPEELRHKYAPWLARVAALRAIDDPRIAAAFVAMLRTPPFLDRFAGPATAYDPLLEALVRLGDVRQLEPLRALADRPNAPRSWLRNLQANAIPPVADELARAVVHSLRPEERDRVAALVRGLAPPRDPRATADDEELLALVRADPDDDGPREVLADRWLERDDPRGQLVTLQLKEARGAATSADAEVIASLVRAVEKSFRGPLATVTGNRQWHRGFLDEVELLANSVASPQTWTDAAADPALATVRFIHKGRANEKHFRSMVMAAPNLRDTVAVSKGMLAELCAAPPPRLEQLGLEVLATSAMLSEIAATFSGLQALWLPLTAKNVETQIARVAAFARRVPSFDIGARWDLRHRDTDAAVRWLLALRTELVSMPQLSVSFDTKRDGVSIAVTAGEAGLRVRVCAWFLRLFEPILDALRPIEHLTLVAPAGGAHRIGTLPGEDDVYKRLIATIPDITLDDAWRAARKDG